MRAGIARPGPGPQRVGSRQSGVRARGRRIPGSAVPARTGRGEIEPGGPVDRGESGRRRDERGVGASVRVHSGAREAAHRTRDSGRAGHSRVSSPGRAAPADRPAERPVQDLEPGERGRGAGSHAQLDARDRRRGHSAGTVGHSPPRRQRGSTCGGRGPGIPGRGPIPRDPGRTWHHGPLRPDGSHAGRARHRRLDEDAYIPGVPGARSEVAVPLAGGRPDHRRVQRRVGGNPRVQR